MPIFEYQCPECKATTEAFLRVEDREKKVFRCPKCAEVMKLVPFSKPAPFRWGKGGGWNG
jgi:putative FmdB family regulatory protein